MGSINDEKLFETYYQVNYDFNTSSLTEKEVDKIKLLAKEKRVNYALAPIGENIFNFILKKSPNIHFELVEFDKENIDGMLYIPKSGQDKAYIILNSKKPLINQIFTATHEYYHYIEDYDSIKKEPYICHLSCLKKINEKKASRFAAELLLPDESLKNEINFYKKNVWSCKKKLGFEQYATICMMLTVDYQIPLKAVIYRLHEEGYIENIQKYIKEYQFIKSVLLQADILKDKVNRLYSNSNTFIDKGSLIYQDIEAVYKNGLASREEIIKDAQILKLDKNIIHSFFDSIDESDEEQDDSDLITLLKDRWGGVD
jgi:Zn-dependent peptidase ImmA (M78 family)